MAFKDKDFLLVEYTATIKETGEIVETTDAETAKKHNIFDEEKVYEPMLIIIGEGRVVKGLEEALKEMKEGEEKTIEVPPEKAYGVRDPNKLRRLPLREFRKADVEPIPGRIVEINGIPAVVRDISGGRVLVDFNHPLAGKTIVYQVKIVKQIPSDEEKIKALLKRRFKPKNLDAYEIKILKEEGMVEIRVPEDEMLNPDIQLAKKALAREIFNYIDGVKKTVFIEELKNPKAEEKKEEQAEEQKQEEGKEAPGEEKE